MPFGTSKTALVATFTSTGTSVKVGGTTQVSGTTSNDFTNAVTYRVTAADATYQDYAVTVTVNTNAVPISSSVLIKQDDNHVTEIGLTENTTRNVVITATVTDGNGCADLVSVSVKLFRTSQTSAGDANANYRYIADTVTQLTCADLVATYSATIPVQYYAEPTDTGSIYATDSWSAEVIPSDGDVTGTTEANDTAEMATMMAMSVTTPISYGAMSMGDNTGTADKDTTVTNTGNGRFATYVDGYGAADADGYSMVCDTGTVPLANEKWSTGTGVAYGSRTNLTDTLAQVTGSFVNKSTDGNNNHGHINWGFGMPESGVLGSCHGKVVFTPVLSNPS
jgi:hypothetical protein